MTMTDSRTTNCTFYNKLRAVHHLRVHITNSSTRISITILYVIVVYYIVVIHVTVAIYNCGIEIYPKSKDNNSFNMDIHSICPWISELVNQSYGFLTRGSENLMEKNYAS